MTKRRVTKTLCGLTKVAVGLSLALSISPGLGLAQEIDGDGKPWQDFANAVQGKTVAMVPMSLGFDLAQAYDGALRSQGESLGYNYIARDPNWSVEGAVQIAEQYVAEGVDVMVIHPFDDKAFNRVLKKAQDAGIFTIFVNLRNGAGTDSMNSDAYIGPDHYKIGKIKADLAAQYCKDSPTKKIALTQAPLANAVGITETAGFLAGLKEHPELQLVAQQVADSDASKARAVAEVMLKQDPDLCAIVDQWDGQAIGIAPAIEEAGLKGKVALITSGGGSQTNACDKIKDGSYTAYISHDVGNQTLVLKALISQVLQTKPVTGAARFLAYMDPVVITAENADSGACWDLGFVTRELP